MTDPRLCAPQPRQRTSLVALLIVLAAACSIPANARDSAWKTDILAETFQITRQGHIDVPIADVHQGCPKRDCIISIDEPGFASADAAAGIADDDLVLGVVIDGVARAYPAYILNHSEVVNDTVANQPIAITYCPLCGSGLAFHRQLGDKTVEFGVSGLLHNSDLILYDRDSKSLWQQITGTAIAGPRRGETLTGIPLSMTTWSEWRAAHPATGVLAADAGRPLRVTNKKPYGDYASSPRLMFPANAEAARLLHPKEVVHGLRLPQGAFAVSERRLTADTVVHLPLDGTTLVWQRAADGRVTVTRDDSGEVHDAHRMFWFAWYSFNTDTALLDTEREVAP
ncbi:DUF3179 domain-containing protein [Elongatibacter sediminis]|uniref:DUF3179 domain-containing protein n=1 Tax=Elongatibacter sediminis TaxID=3119006 RepID=A0AAW9RNJ6_9GAMM